MSVRSEVGRFTMMKVRRLLSDVSSSTSKASLAIMRRGIGRSPGEIPELWGDFLLDMPDVMLGNGREISRAEWATYIALTCFALHQQGRSGNDPMHVEGISLGKAANRLIKKEDDRERISRRFYPVAMSENMKDMSSRLRGLITLFRSEGIPLDYGKLAMDLYDYQLPEYRESVRLRWGEDFCRIKKENNNESGKGKG